MTARAEAEGGTGAGRPADPGRGRADRISLLALALAVTGAAAVRIASAHYSLWFDELASLFFASRPLAQLWSAWMLRETNPPLFYSLLHGWIGIFGLGEVSLRLPSILASLLAMIAFYLGMARGYGPKAAAAAVLLLATSGQQLYFSHQVRPYIFLYLTVVISFFGLMRVAARVDGEEHSRAGWLVYAGAALVGLYLHTTALLWPAAAGPALMTLDRRFRPGGTEWRTLLSANLAIAAGGAWWIGMTYLQLRSPNGNIGWMEGLGLKKATLVFVATMLQSRQIGVGQAAAPLLIAILAAFGVVATWRRARTRLTVLLFLWSTGLFLLIDLKQPIILDRTLFWLSIFPLAMAAVGLGAIEDRRTFRLMVVALTALQSVNLALLAPRLERENWRAVVVPPAADRRAMLLVDGEAMSIATRMACTVELGAATCPFPVVTLLAGNRQLDGWGRGYAAPAPASPDGRLKLAGDTHLYLLRRPFHDALDDVRAAGLLQAWPAEPLVELVLVGQLPRRFNNALVMRSRVRAGLVRLVDRRLVAQLSDRPARERREFAVDRGTSEGSAAR